MALTPTGVWYSSSKQSTGSLSLYQRIGNRRRGDDNFSWRRLARLSHGCNFRLSGNVLRQRFGLFEMLPAVADLIHERQDRHAPDRERYDEARLAGDRQHVKLAPFEYGQKWFIRDSLTQTKVRPTQTSCTFGIHVSAFSAYDHGIAVEPTHWSGLKINPSRPPKVHMNIDTIYATDKQMMIYNAQLRILRGRKCILDRLGLGGGLWLVGILHNPQGKSGCYKACSASMSKGRGPQFGSLLRFITDPCSNAG